MRIEVRIAPRAKTMRCMTIANANPMTSSTATVTTMMITVLRVSCQNSESVSTVR